MKQLLMAVVAAGLLTSMSVAQDKTQKKEGAVAVQPQESKKECGMDCCEEGGCKKMTKAGTKTGKATKAAKTSMKGVVKSDKSAESKE